MRKDIQEKIEKINTALSAKKKVAIARDLLLNTDIIKSENTLCQFDDEKWYSEKNYLKKFLEYKKEGPTIYRNIDCDVSLLCTVMYILLNKNLDLKNITSQVGYKKKYEIEDGKRRFRGDTLTSAIYILKRYLGCLWKKINNNENLKQIKKYKDFYDLFQGVARTGIPKSPAYDWLSYCQENSNIIWEAMDEEAKMFLKNYNMFGNYMCIPGNSYKIKNDAFTSFNIARSNFGRWDTVDTLLCKIYLYYKYSERAYIKSIFTPNNKIEEITDEAIDWLNMFNGWSDFIEKNVLSPFVDTETLIPVSLKTGKTIEEDELSKYDAIPKSYSEFLTFFTQVSQRIKQRSERICKKLTSC